MTGSGWRCLCLLLCLLLSACGGGGGGASTPAPNPAPEPQPDPDPQPEPPPTVSIAGTLVTAPGQTLDGDTNDPLNPLIDNDDPGSPQLLSNPITLGGYVNEAGAGTEGRSRGSGDPEDYFQVDLLAGQRINLIVAEFEESDADLYLYDESGELVDFSVATGELEEIGISESGRYTVNVSIFSGATNYTLAIGVPLSPAAAPVPADIVPWEAVVDYAPDAAADAESQRAELLRRWGARQLGGGPRRARLLGINREQRDLQTLRNRLGRQYARRGDFADDALAARWETLLAVKRLRSTPGIRTAEPNYRLRPLASVNDESYPIQWHYPLINVPGAWDTTTGGGVIVAVVDTGILSGHPDLAGQLVPGYDFVRNPSEAGDGDGIDPDPEERVGAGDPAAVNYHGSHVAGTVAARANNRIGVAGVAYGARVMPVRALGSGGGTSYDVRQAVRFAAGLDNDSGTRPARRADIINLSIGGESFSPLSQDLYRELRQRGITVVAAAGNERSTRNSYPAGYDTVIAVSAVDVERRITRYSNRGAAIDVAAPGGDGSRDLNGDGYPDGVLSTGANNGRFAYTFLSGTSMAAPHVAGVFALMKAANPDLDADDIDRLLQQGRLTQDSGEPGRDDLYGHGLIDARRAVDAALVAGGGESTLPPRLTSSTSALNFGTTSSALNMTLSNAGSGELSVDGVEADQPWISVRAVDVDAEGLGRYRVSVDRRSLDPGVFEGRVTATSSVNTVVLRILVAVANVQDTELGTLYLIVYDPETDEVVAETLVRRNGNGYAYSMQGVPVGAYQLFAGTDLDNDLLICDAGEACGAYLTIEQPLTVTLDANRSRLDFPIEFLLALPSTSAATPTQARPLPVLRRSADAP